MQLYNIGMQEASLGYIIIPSQIMEHGKQILRFFKKAFYWKSDFSVVLELLFSVSQDFIALVFQFGVLGKQERVLVQWVLLWEQQQYCSSAC